MNQPTPLIGTGKLARGALAGQVAIVTGAGRGIGFEAARALAWLGARAVIAEIDGASGAEAAARIDGELGPGSALFVPTDVGDEASVANLAREAQRIAGRVDIVINNATVTPMGTVPNVPIAEWDRSYRVNLRGPVLLARAFLPGMLERHCGVFVLVSSVGSAYMSAYESFKAAQVHLANTLDDELQGTGVIAFTIGPGIVHTPGAEEGLARLAPLMGKRPEEIFEMNRAFELSPEAAGAGFAAAVALAPQFAGDEIGSIQALVAAGISIATGEDRPPSGPAAQVRDRERTRALCERVRVTLAEQAEGWKKRSLFERQWVIRDFRKTAGMPVDEWLAALAKFEQGLASDGAPLERPPLEKLAAYYRRLFKMATDYLQKDPVKLKEQTAIVQTWIDEVDELIRLV